MKPVIFIAGLALTVNYPVEADTVDSNKEKAKVLNKNEKLVKEHKSLKNQSTKK